MRTVELDQMLREELRIQREKPSAIKNVERIMMGRMEEERLQRLYIKTWYK